MDRSAEKLFQERVGLMEDAVALKEGSRVPVAPFFSSVKQRLFGSSYRDLYYDYDRAGKAAVEFYRKYPIDAAIGCSFVCGKAQEIAESSMIEWPGRPGTKISIYSSHQVLENEYIQPEEYRALIDDFDGFMMSKYIPRAFPGLKALGEIHFNPTIVLSASGGMAPLFTPDALEAYEKLRQIAELEAETNAKTEEYDSQITALGIPPYMTGGGEVPFDIISDYFRTTLGAMEDSMEYEDEMLELMDIFAERQIAGWKYLENPMPVKRVFFPLHKGMDGFMSAEHYERLYLKPFKKMIDYLVSIGVTPIIYTEGKYNSRLEALRDFLPAGKCIVHFETADMKEAKRILGGKSCISGNLSANTLEFGTVEQTIDETKNLIDTCAPGGGYIFDTNACLENAKVENLEAMLETLEIYGKK